jgi:UDP-N-acetylmuramate dehydrogenase
MIDEQPTPIPRSWIANAELSKLTSFAVPARARWLVSIEQEDELPAVLRLAEARDLPVLVLGGGSNVLFTANYPGLVVVLALRGIRVQQQDGLILLTAAAGENWHHLVEFSLSRGWFGLENLALIPGSVGAAPVQNIGAYGVEIADRLHSVRYLDLQLMQVVELSAEQCRFSYRDSIFKQELKGRAVILSVTMRLSETAVTVLHYPALREALASPEEQPITAQQVFAAVCALRRSKLPDPAVLGNAGSFFRNPVISRAQLLQLRAQWPTLPAYEVDDGHVKLPAAWLIDQAGWKGVRRGAIGVHDKQALVLIHDFRQEADTACAGARILQLAKDIAADIRHRFAVQLEPEVQIIPADAWEQM